LLRLMLNAHSAIVVPPESGFLLWWFQKYRTWGIVDNQPDTISTFISDLKTSKKIETWNLDYLRLSDFIANKNPANYGELGACVYEFFGQQRGKTPIKLVGDKNNYYIKTSSGSAASVATS
jgi:hypothetical protein